MPDRIDNPYEPPEQVSLYDNRQRRPLALSIFTILFLAALLLAIGVSRSQLTTIFEDYDVELPTISKLSLHFAIVLAAALALAAAIVAVVTIRRRRMAIVCQLVLVGFGTVLLILYVLGGVLPLIRLISALS